MNILLIEDEPLAAERLRSMVQRLRPQANVLGPLDTIEDSLVWFAEHGEPDVVLLDIELADGKSFDLLKARPLKCPVIFCTAYNQYALEAFQHQGMAYLLKPIKEEELKQALDRIQPGNLAANIDYHRLAEALEQRQNAYQKRMLVRIGQKFKAIETEDIAYAFTDQKMVMLMTKDGKEVPADHTLEQLEAILDPAKFFRINRKLLVHFSAIEGMYAWSRSRVKLDLKPTKELDSIVSTERASEFKAWLESGRKN